MDLRGRLLVVLAWGTFVGACASTTPSAPRPGAGPSTTVPSGTTTGTGGPSVPALAEGDLPRDAWRVSTFPKFDDRAPSLVESWPTLDHAWTDACGPGRVVAERRLCLPAGDYVFESRSTEHVEVTVDERIVTSTPAERSGVVGGAVVELSPPVHLTDCAVVRVASTGRGCFPAARWRIVVREARKAPSCDRDAFPRGAWNACVSAGRNREEPLVVLSWPSFRNPWPAAKGPPGWDGPFVVDATTTACFDPGKYVFHAHAPPSRLAVSIDDLPAFRSDPATSRGVTDSEPRDLRGCHRMRASFLSTDGASEFDFTWAKVGSPTERGWAKDALACDPACASDARCVAAAPFGVTRKGARICRADGRAGRLGEACDPARGCARESELLCCRPDTGCGHGAGVCTYVDR